jgi:octanoyl-[GcvH]:protein N-octanoyltransferase
MKPVLQLMRKSFPERPQLGPALSRAILERVAAGELPETARLGRPGRVVAFGRQDTVSPGYQNAVAAARDAGYATVERLAGGRAAVYTEGSLSFSRAYRDPSPRGATEVRFRETAELIREALRRLAVDARIGEVEGEYCPGAFSVNAGGRRKLAGIGQRLVSGAAHVGGVLVVTDSREVRRVLEPVYAALELDWVPATAGSVEDEAPGASLDSVSAAILEVLDERFRLVEVEPDRATMKRAEALARDRAGTA